MPQLPGTGAVAGLMLVAAGLLRKRPRDPSNDDLAAVSWLEEGQQGVCAGGALRSGVLPSRHQLLFALATSATSGSGLAAHGLVTCMLAGLIWTIQLVR